MNVMKDICLTEGLSGSLVMLMNPIDDRLNAVYSMAKTYATGIHANLRLERSTNRKDALRDADFVIDTVLAGGHEQQEIVRRVGEKHGYYRGVESAEFNMISDYSTTFQGYYQLKFFLDPARDMEEVCPDALLIDVANPECEAGTLLTRETKIKVAGYCHGYLGYADIATELGINTEDVDFDMAGFNHNIWLTRFRNNEQDGYPLIDDWIENKSQDYWSNHKQRNEFDIDMSRSTAVDMCEPTDSTRGRYNQKW